MHFSRLVFCSCLFVGLLLDTASAQTNYDPAEPGTPQFERELQQIRLLTLPFKKDWAAKVVQSHPKTKMAEVLGRLLTELKLIEAAAHDDPRFRNLPARSEVASSAPPLTIHNSTAEPVVLQIKGPAMLWTRPMILRANSSFTINYPVLHRKFIGKRETIHALSLGKRYEFRIPKGSAAPRLFTVE